MANNGEGGNRHACAACKHQRKKCKEGCIFSLYFPGHRSEEFQSILKIFGVSNLSKLLNSIQNARDREQAVESIRWEASMWEKDSVHGPLGAYRKLELQLELLKRQQNQQIPQEPILPYVNCLGLIGINKTEQREARIIPNNGVMCYRNTNQNNFMQREDMKGQAMDRNAPPPPNYVTMAAQGQERISRGSGIVIPERPVGLAHEPQGKGQRVGCSSSIIGRPMEQTGSQGRGYVTPLYSTVYDQQQGIDNYQGNHKIIGNSSYRQGQERESQIRGARYNVASSYSTTPAPSIEGASQGRGYWPYPYNNFIQRQEMGQNYDGLLVQQQRQIYAERNTNHSQTIQSDPNNQMKHGNEQRPRKQ
ncbi:LOB domain-containing-like protein [Melia azedarach]|uniref:LOB domain-containing-like protein n=1 Tax=Melia azedarach TaxID=155640 RepID=A0ACC1WXF3_MELAZ|nr:LOB domain-containing-like protein [Melia azedarach]